jgi:hypothetical protein
MEQGAGDPRRIARTVLQAVDDYNSIVENSVRLAAFQAARKQGLTPQRAASIAKNITVNFNRKGNASAGINAWFMFFNASVQGTATILKAAAKSPKARAVLGGMALTGFLLDMVNREVMGDDYEAIPDFEKSHNAIFQVGRDLCEGALPAGSERGVQRRAPDVRGDLGAVPQEAGRVWHVHGRCHAGRVQPHGLGRRHGRVFLSVRG